MRNHRRAGFGMTELIVILAILGVFLGLVLGYFGRLQGRSKDIQSKNNMRQIGLAMLAHETNAGEFPAHMDDKGYSAFYPLMEYLELDALIKQIDTSKPPTDKKNQCQVKVFSSPSDPLVKPGNYMGASYFFCAGPKASLKDNDGVFAPGAKWSAAAISNNRGTSIAVMMGETLRGDGSDKATDVRRQHVVLKKDALKQIKDDAGVDDFKDGKNIAGNRGACWLDGRFLQTTFTGTRPVDDPRPDVDCDGAGGLSALRSLTGRTNLLFVDGHVESISKKSGADVWKAITSVKNTDLVEIK